MDGYELSPSYDVESKRLNSPPAKTIASQQPDAASKGFFKEGAFVYVQALCPYATSSEIAKILRSTNDVEIAVKRIYDAHNPDTSTLDGLKKQWDAQRNSEQAGCSNEPSSLEHVNLLLAKRAQDIFHTCHFADLSLSRDYNFTVRVFPIDTSEWDREVLFEPSPLQTTPPGSRAFPFSQGGGPPVRDNLSQDKLKDEPSCCIRQGASPIGTLQASRTLLSHNNWTETKSVGSSAEAAMPSVPVIRWVNPTLRAQFSVQTLLQESRLSVLDSVSPSYMGSDLAKLDINSRGFRTVRTKGTESLVAPEPSALVTPPNSHRTYDADCAEKETVISSLGAFAEDRKFCEREMLPLTLCTEEGSSGRICTVLVEPGLISDPLPQTIYTLSPKWEITNEALEGWIRDRYFSSLRSEANPATESFSNEALKSVEAGIIEKNDEKKLLPSKMSIKDDKTKILEAILSQDSESVRFLLEEEDRWKAVISRLEGFSNVFDEAGHSDIVQEIYHRCPSFMNQLDDILRALLQVLSKEALGSKLITPLDQVPVHISLLGRKLLSTSELKINELQFDEKKSSCQIIDNGTHLKLHLLVKRLSFDPIQFAFIGVSEANRQNRNMQLPANFDKDEDLIYTKGVTNGELGIKVRGVSVQLRTKAVLVYEGSVEILVKDVSVSIQSIKLSNSLIRFRLLCFFLKPYIKRMVEKSLCSALLGLNRA